MKKVAVVIPLILSLLLAACSSPAPVPEETTTPAQTIPTTVPPQTAPPTTVPETTESVRIPVLSLTEEEKTMLLKIGMAERGNAKCTECIALVMRTLLNRVESGQYASIRSALFAQGQFTPVSDGSYYSAKPNKRCQEALDMVIYGWDESQGALYYEWCEGESWHSQNLNLLFQHCDVRFYN